MTTATLDDWRTAAEHITVERPEIGVHIVNYGDSKDMVSVEVTELVLDECADCEEPIRTDNPGPVEAINVKTGQEDGAWSHQHGCGEWNSPESVRRTFDLGDEIDPDNELYVTDILDEMLSEVDAKVADDRARIRRRIITNLQAEMRQAIRFLADGEDERAVLIRDDTPGVCRDLDTGKLQGWTPLPWDDPEGVIVNEEDL